MSAEPEFKDYRHTSDGIMVADVGFKRQLWALDPELDVVWDWASERWEIWRFPGQPRTKRKIKDDKAHHVMTVETKGKTFRELGADILIKLQEADSHKFSLKQLIDYFEKIDDNLQRTKRKDFEAKTRDIGLEVEWFFKGLRVQIPRRFAQAAHKLEGPSSEVKMIRAVTNG